jgi:tetratricopeptide (TPR) repeat protein
MGSLGVILAHRNRTAEAEQILRATIQICMSDSAAELREVGAVAQANLARLQMLAGRVAEASKLYKQALTQMGMVPAPSPATLTTTLAGYATALFTLGDHETAAILYRQAIAVAQMHLGQDHVILAELYEQYSRLVRSAGRKSEARNLAEAARRIQNAWRRDNMTGHTVEYESLLQKK